METESLDRTDGRLWQNAFSFTDDTYSHGMRSMHSQAFGFSHFRWSIHSEMISHRITRFPFTNRAKAFCDVANLSCFFLEKKMLFRLNRKSYEDILVIWTAPETTIDVRTAAYGEAAGCDSTSE